MEWNALFNLIDPKLLIVVACCWALGFVLKQTPRVPDWTIVYIVTLFAVAFTVWMLGVTPDAFMQGILCGAVAVFGHQLVKQAKQADGGDSSGN
jgi:hypothetical protein